jgi:signal transduction histidine kinase
VAEPGRFPVDPLGPVQLLAVADETSSLLRHELRNKFASVRNAEFYIRRRLRETEPWRADPRVEEMSGIIRDELRLANELLDQRVQLTQLFAPAPCLVDAAESVRLAVGCTRTASACAVTVRVDAQSGYVMADPNELALAVRCLLENAIEATGLGGEVLVRAAPVAARYSIQVEDAGAGVPESQRGAVLEPFHTTKPGHAGLGLNIARRIAERYGGTLQFSARPVGTAVALDLELAAAGG